MEHVEVHIVNYDQSNHTVVAYFTGIQDGVQYSTPSYSFSVTNYNSPTVEDLVKDLARTGFQYLLQIAENSTAVVSSPLISQLNSLTNTNHKFSYNELQSDIHLTNLDVNTDLEIQI